MSIPQILIINGLILVEFPGLPIYSCHPIDEFLDMNPGENIDNIRVLNFGSEEVNVDMVDKFRRHELTFQDMIQIYESENYIIAG